MPATHPASPRPQGRVPTGFFRSLLKKGPALVLVLSVGQVGDAQSGEYWVQVFDWDPAGAVPTGVIHGHVPWFTRPGSS